MSAVRIDLFISIVLYSLESALHVHILLSALGSDSVILGGGLVWLRELEIKK